MVGAGGYLEPASTGSGAGRRGGFLRQNWHHNRCLTGDPASAGRVEDFGGHDATTRTDPEVVGRRALAKPWLNFKLASGLWPASRCPQSANQNRRTQFEPKQSLAPISAPRHNLQPGRSSTGDHASVVCTPYLLVNEHRTFTFTLAP